MTGTQTSFNKAERLFKSLLEELASVAEDAPRLSFFTGDTLLPFLQVLAHFIPGKTGEKIANIIAKTEKGFSPAWNVNDGGFEALPPLLLMLKSALKKPSKMDGLHLMSAGQEIALTVAGLALGMPALGAIGFAASSWVAVADAGYQYYAAKRRTNPLYLAAKKIEEIEELQGGAGTASLTTDEANQKINLLITQTDALLYLAQTNTKAQTNAKAQTKKQSTLLEKRLSGLRGGNQRLTPINDQPETTLNETQKRALANVLIQEQEDIMERCKKEIPTSIAAAVVMTAMAAVTILANVVIIAAAVAATPYLPFIIGTGLSLAALAIGVVKFAQVLDNRLYTSKAVNHATTAGKKDEQLLETAVAKQGLDLPIAETSLSKEQQQGLIKKQAREEYSASEGVVSHLKTKAEETASGISTAFCSFFNKISSSVSGEPAFVSCKMNKA